MGLWVGMQGPAKGREHDGGCCHPSIAHAGPPLMSPLHPCPPAPTGAPELQLKWRGLLTRAVAAAVVSNDGDCPEDDVVVEPMLNPFNWRS